MTAEVTTSDVEITAPPEGMVSAKDVVAAVAKLCVVHQWCEAAENLMRQHLKLPFRGRKWDSNLEAYDVGPCALADDAPEFVSKEDLHKLAVSVSSYYREFRDLREFFARFGVELVEYQDRWLVSVELSALDIEEETGFIVNEDMQLDDDDFTYHVRQVARQRLYADRGVQITYIPDPKRSEPTGSNVPTVE